jgi:hypothetical protein
MIHPNLAPAPQDRNRFRCRVRTTSHKCRSSGRRTPVCRYSRRGSSGTGSSGARATTGCSKNGRLNSQDQADSPVVRRDTTPVREPRNESGSGPESDTGIDSALTRCVFLYATRICHKQKPRPQRPPLGRNLHCIWRIWIQNMMNPWSAEFAGMQVGRGGLLYRCDSLPLAFQLPIEFVRVGGAEGVMSPQKFILE